MKKDRETFNNILLCIEAFVTIVAGFFVYGLNSIQMQVGYQLVFLLCLVCPVLLSFYIASTCLSQSGGFIFFLLPGGLLIISAPIHWYINIILEKYHAYNQGPDGYHTLLIILGTVGFYFFSFVMSIIVATLIYKFKLGKSENEKKITNILQAIDAIDDAIFK